MKRWEKTTLTILLLAAGVYLLVYPFAAKQPRAADSPQNLPAIIVLDAGHGGEDGGATSVSGVPESRYNLEIARRLRDLFAFAGVQTHMIRETDTAVYTGSCRTIAEKKISDLKNRAKTVNALPNALLISIHQNFFPEPKYRGTQVFYAGTDGSEALAKIIQDTVRETVDPDNHRQIKKSQSVYLMEHIRCTGVLVECGFLSNAQEDELLKTPAYQKKLAAAIAGSAARYLEGNFDEV
jgi:N-acetylmuramoyl-L-alanine amidase